MKLSTWNLFVVPLMDTGILTTGCSVLIQQETKVKLELSLPNIYLVH